MKIFNSYNKALASFSNKDVLYINSYCPYKDDLKLCGNWCALFYFNDENKDNTTPYAILGCKATDMRLYVDGVEK